MEETTNNIFAAVAACSGLTPQELELRTESIRHEANLGVLRKSDPNILDIVQRATYVSAYVLNEEEQVWSRADIEGALYVVVRLNEPKYRIVVLNQLNPTNLVESITPSWEISTEDQYIFFRVPEEPQKSLEKQRRRRVAGLWFSNAAERAVVYKAIRDILETLIVPEGRSESDESQKNDTPDDPALSPGATILSLLGVVRNNATPVEAKECRENTSLVESTSDEESEAPATTDLFGRGGAPWVPNVTPGVLFKKASLPKRGEAKKKHEQKDSRTRKQKRLSASPKLETRDAPTRLPEQTDKPDGSKSREAEKLDRLMQAGPADLSGFLPPSPEEFPQFVKEALSDRNQDQHRHQDQHRRQDQHRHQDQQRHQDQHRHQSQCAYQNQQRYRQQDLQGPPYYDCLLTDAVRPGNRDYAVSEADLTDADESYLRRYVPLLSTEGSPAPLSVGQTNNPTRPARHPDVFFERFISRLLLARNGVPSDSVPMYSPNASDWQAKGPRAVRNDLVQRDSLSSDPLLQSLAEIDKQRRDLDNLRARRLVSLADVDDQSAARSRLSSVGPVQSARPLLSPKSPADLTVAVLLERDTMLAEELRLASMEQDLIRKQLQVLAETSETQSVSSRPASRRLNAAVVDARLEHVPSARRNGRDSAEQNNPMRWDAPTVRTTCDSNRFCGLLR